MRCCKLKTQSSLHRCVILMWGMEHWTRSACPGWSSFLPLRTCSVPLGTSVKGGRGTCRHRRALRRMKRHVESGRGAARGRDERAGCFLGTTLALERWITSRGPSFPAGKWDQIPHPPSPWCLDLCESASNQNVSHSVSNASEWAAAPLNMRCVEIHCHPDFNILRLPFESHVPRGG